MCDAVVMQQHFDDVLDEIREAAAQAPGAESLMQHVCELINAGLPGYDWVGFYMLDPQDANTLVLGPYVGAATEHTRIPVSEGICGAAVAQAATVIVNDVRSDPRYISCSIETQSEIVAPIYAACKIVGEIDIDSHEPARFVHEDKAFVEDCAALVGKWLEEKA